MPCRLFSRIPFWKLLYGGGLSILLVACRPSTTSKDLSEASGKSFSKDTAMADQSVQVSHAGALRNFMMHNDLSSQIRLDSLQDRKQLFGLGALAGLRGELLIWDSEPLIAQAKEGRVHLRQSWKDSAALLVYSSVAQWSSLSLGNAQTKDSLSKSIPAIAAQHGLDTSQAFPFRLEGTFENLAWHVINWDASDSIHSHEKHRQSGAYGREQAIQAEVLGFYSQQHQGIFTHHSSPLHMHYRLKGDQGSWQGMGHVDALTTRPGLRLFLPQPKGHRAN